MFRNYVFAACLTFVTADASAQFDECFEQAAARYNFDPALLKAIAAQESGFNAKALNLNKDGSWDIGVMQINTQWLPALSQFGIDETYLWEPCWNIHIGAWILAKNVEDYGYNWFAVGAYNAGPRKTKKAEAARNEYANKIDTRLALRRNPRGLLVSAEDR